MYKLLVILGLSVLFIAFVFSCSDNDKKKQQSLSIKETFDRYVKAIHNSDLDALFETVTDKEKFFFATSSGKLIDTRDGYYEFHKNWFSQKDWEITFELIEAVEGTEYGYTNAIYDYYTKLDDGRTFTSKAYFTLIFHNENGRWKVVTDVITPISRYIVEKDRDIKYTPEQQHVFDIIHTRRTVRKYKSTPVPEEHIIKILDAARMCPTAGNQQPWKFLVVRDRNKLDELQDKALSWYVKKYKDKSGTDENKIEELRKSLKGIMKNVLSAPVYIAVLVDTETKYPDYIIYDGSLAAGYLMIAARTLGYGTGFFTTFFPDKEMKKFFDIPDKYKLICFTPIGVPEKWPETPQKKNLDDIVVFDSFK